MTTIIDFCSLQVLDTSFKLLQSATSTTFFPLSVHSLSELLSVRRHPHRQRLPVPCLPVVVDRSSLLLLHRMSLLQSGASLLTTYFSRLVGGPPSTTGSFGHTISQSLPQSSSSSTSSQPGTSSSASGNSGGSGGGATFNAASRAGTGSIIATLALAAVAGAALMGC